MAALIALAAPVFARAAIITWDGGAATGAWGTTTNWSTNTVPLAADSLVFNAAAANGQYTLTLGAARTTAGITFNNAIGTNLFTFNAGSTLTINAGGITNNDAQTQRFNSAIIANAAQTWNAAAGGITSDAVTLNANLTLGGAGAITFGVGMGALVNSAGDRTLTNSATGSVTIDTVNLSNNATGRTFTISGTGDTTITGVIADGGGSTGGNLVKSGTGTLTLSVASSYTGTTTLNGGVLVMNAGNLLGTTPGAPVANKLIFDGGTLNSTANTTIHINRGVTINAGGGTIDVDTGTTLSYAGIMTGAGTFNKTGLGTFTFDGANTSTHTGNINVSAGTMQIARTVANSAIGDSAAVTVAAGATLAFNGGVSETVGSIAGAGAIDNINATAITLTSGGNNASTTFSGIIRDTGGNLLLVKNGTSTLTLSGANSYVGTTSINAGVVNLRHNTALGTAAAGTLVVAGAALELQNNITVTGETLLLSGTGVGGNGALRSISGANTWTGAISLGANSEIQSDAGTLTISGSISGATRALSVDGAGNTTISGVIGTTTGTLTKNGAGTLTLTNTNTFTGAITVDSGVLSISSEGNLGDTTSTAALTLNGGTLRTTGADFTVATSLRDIVLGASGGTIDTVNNFTWDNGISGAGSLTKIGTGSLTILDPTTFTGNFDINAGSVIFDGGNDRLVDTVAVTIASGATLNVNTRSDTIGSLEGAGTLTNATAAATAATVTFGGLNTNTTFSGTITDTTGALNLVKTGTGTTIFSGTNSYVGTTTINAGTLSVATIGNGGVAGNLGAASTTATNLVLGGGTLQYRGLTASTDRNFVLTAGTTSTIDVTARNLTISGASTATTGALTKTGAGTLTLSGANLYTGATTVSAGTLALNTTAANALASTVITVGDGIGAANSATLLLSQSNQIADTAAVTVNSDGLFNVNGQSETIGSLAGAGAVNIGSGSLITAGNTSTTFSGTMAGTGSFTKGGTGILTLDNDLTFNGTFNLAGGTLRLNDMALTLDTLIITGNSTIDFAGVSSLLDIMNFNISGGVILTVTNWSNTVDHFFTQNWSGAVANTRGIAPMNQVVFTGFTAANTQWQGYDDQITPVPEPSTYGALLLGALTAFFAWRRRRV